MDDPAVAEALAKPGRARFVQALLTLDPIASEPDAWLACDAFTAVDACNLVVRRWAERINVDVSAFSSWLHKSDLALERPPAAPAPARKARPTSAAVKRQGRSGPL